MGIKRIFGGATALAMVFASTVVTPQIALAVPPETERFDFVDSGVASECDGFDIIANYTGTVTLTTFFNAQGDPVRVQFHGRARGTLRNLDTGYTVKDAPSIRNSFFDLVKGTATHVGVDFHITVPGAGVVVLQAGRIVFTGAPPPTFVAGPHLGPPAASNAALCAALNH